MTSNPQPPLRKTNLGYAINKNSQTIGDFGEGVCAEDNIETRLVENVKTWYLDNVETWLLHVWQLEIKWNSVTRLIFHRWLAFLDSDFCFGVTF